MRSTSVTPPYQTRSFWIAVAFTLFCSGNFFLFLFSNSTIKDANFKLQYTIIYSTFTILKNIFICIGIATNEVLIDGKANELIQVDEDWEIPTAYKKINP